MTISARIIQASRKQHDCAGLCCHGIINPREAHLRLYGRAETGDPAWNLRLCLQCAWAYRMDDSRTAESIDTWLASQPRVARHGDPQFEAVRVGSTIDRCGQAPYLFLTGYWAGRVVYVEPCKMEEVMSLAGRWPWR